MSETALGQMPCCVHPRYGRLDPGCTRAWYGRANRCRSNIDAVGYKIEFKLGHGGYYGPGIKTYFEALSGSSHPRYIVADNPDGSLFGMYKTAGLETRNSSAG